MEESDWEYANRRIAELVAEHKSYKAIRDIVDRDPKFLRAFVNVPWIDPVTATVFQVDNSES